MTLPPSNVHDREQWVDIEWVCRSCSTPQADSVCLLACGRGRVEVECPACGVTGVMALSVRVTLTASAHDAR